MNKKKSAMPYPLSTHNCHVSRGYSFESLRAKILFTQGYRKVKRKKKFKEVEVTFGKMLPSQIPNQAQTTMGL